tara:strand:- start:2188 stop:3375 length:1188 start_codon:yes stop_codon:yes gene_type:complete
MAQLLHGNCIEEMKQLENRSVDLIFCDLPYATKSYSAVNCKWNTPIDLDAMWKEFMRIKKFTTPIFMTCNTKFGVDLINSAPKDCPFRYDLVWCKSSPCGHLLAKKMPMRKHEMVYVFYERLPLYDISSHKHKFLKEEKQESTGVVKEEYEGNYGKLQTPDYVKNNITRNKLRREYKKNGDTESTYDPPLPTSLIKEEEEDSGIKKVMRKNTTYGNVMSYEIKERKNGEPRYDPPLPTSLIKEEHDNVYGWDTSKNIDNRPSNDRTSAYEPPLPTSLIKEEEKVNGIYGELPTTDNYGESIGMKKADKHKVQYEPALPTSLLEIKSSRGKHSTEKPVALMEWILKYYSKEGDVVLDPTMGSGSTGVSCKNMNRNFIGIEMDDEIYEGACARIWGE